MTHHEALEHVVKESYSEGRRAGILESCKVACIWCNGAEPERDGAVWVHRAKGFRVECSATAMRNLL